MRPLFVVTIDTEGDDQWSWRHGRPITTHNARFLPRFQSLCERFGWRPSYLVSYEMALDLALQRLGRDALRRGAAEIGLHVHAWSSPPLRAPEWERHPIYLYDLPDDLVRDKIDHLTHLLERVFEVRPVSHRAGRWGFDERIARALVDAGYQVDCSVTPGVSWRHCGGAPGGRVGPSFEGFAHEPYFLDLADIRRRGTSPLLEVPVTIRPRYPRPLARVLGRVAGPPCAWLRPDGRNGRRMREVVDWALAERLPVVEFMLHSSELMPGGSPTFPSAEAIERLYADLEALFAHVAEAGVRGATLSEVRAAWGWP